MNRSIRMAWMSAILALPLVAGAARAATDWPAVDAALGVAGKVTPGDVHRYGWPRSDLHVTVDGVAVEPALALGSWAGFVATGTAATATPQPSAAKVEPTAEAKSAFAAVQQALGRTGSLAGRVLQIGVPRAERIEEHGAEVPASLGMSTAINVQAVGSRVAATGDFVLIAAEVNPVIRELRGHGIAVTAVHSHMLTESPRLFFLHFWALDTPQKVGQGLAAALAKVNVKPVS